ncbi:MAG: S8 family serine peptidase [Prevotella sp.]|nr:S8 family serine peptidase [Prevotella sp.]
MQKLRLALIVLSLLIALPAAAQHKELLKMSPLLRARCMKVLRGDTSSERRVCAFVKSSGDAADLFAANGCSTLADFGDIQILCIPERSLPTLARDERIVKIEAGKTASITNDKTAELLGATMVHEGSSLPQAFTGNGVIVGVQDIGFDLSNPNFYSKDMSRFRIKRLWDMLAETAQSKSQVVDNQSFSEEVQSFNNGLPSRKADENNLVMGEEYTDSAAILALGHSRDGLTCLHGSHTLGTAAGSGCGSPYAGMAYDADICLVANITTDNKDYLADDADDSGTALTALGFKYIFDYADEQGKPCVISFSEGSYEDFTEDNLLYYETLGAMTGEGRIIVASAGNNSQSASYICKSEGKAVGGAFMQNSGDQLYFMAQGTADFDVRLTVYGTDPVAFTIGTAALLDYPDSIFCDTLLIGEQPYIIQRVAYPSAFSTTNIAAEYALTGPAKIGQAAPVSVELIGEEAEIEAYSLVGQFVENDLNPSLADEEISHNVFAPAAAPDVIAVGATAYTTSYENMSGETVTNDYGSGGTRATFSSVGPTLDNRIKPDVMAPGTNIISSTNSFYFEANPSSNSWSNLVDSYAFGGRTYYWKADTGTSMSAPCVAGIIALWLEAKPDLTREEIIDAFAATCTQPDASLSYPNNLYGYGQIDAYKGLLYILGIDKIEGISANQPAGVKVNLAGNNLNIAFEKQLSARAKVNIYSVGGQLLQTAAIQAGTSSATIPLSSAARGIIAVQINAPEPSYTGSFVLRR